MTGIFQDILQIQLYTLSPNPAQKSINNRIISYILFVDFIQASNQQQSKNNGLSSMRKLPSEKIKTIGELPSPRFGHTFTMVSKTKGVLFGGAVSIAGKFVITNETFLYDFTTNAWKKLNFANSFVPSQRAAHAATPVSQMQMVVYGGAASGSQGLLKDQLYLLDLRKQPTWKIIDVAPKNNTPGQRYGHTMVFNKPYLIIFGGNSGSKVQNDVWLLNFQRGPFSWVKYQFQNGRTPCSRVYHSAALCEEGRVAGMMVVYGGRRQTKKDHNGSQRQLTVSALNDIWGLVKHRNGTWDWATPPRSQTYMPIARYQHLVCFMGSKLIIMGGRASNPEEPVSLIQIYDTQTAEWQKVNSVSRYRHAIALQNDTKLFVHGGFQPEYASQPLDSMLCLDLSVFKTKPMPIQNPQVQQQPVQEQPVQQQPAQQIPPQQQIQQPIDVPRQRNMSRRETLPLMRERQGLRQIGQSERNVSNNSRIRLDKSKIQQGRDLTPSRIINSSKNTRLSNQAIVATGDKDRLLVQRVPVHSLMQESKRLNNQYPQSTEDSQQNEVLQQFLQNILNILMPIGTPSKLNGSNLFPLKKDKIYRLCQETTKILLKQQSLIGVRAPIKIFGSLYGRYSQIIRYFDNFDYPTQRQMETFQYIFLGNYVDKSFNSLETICLLMTLKLKYPDHIHLLRGRHQDININKICGFGQQCSMRLGQNINDPQSVFQTVNNMFDHLPLAAAIQDKFLCVNGAIGSTTSIIDIKNIQRPVKVKQNQVVTNLLWSNNGGNQSLGYISDKCTDDSLQIFLEDNGLDMLINTQDGLINGIQQSKYMLSIFSVPNYNKKTNKGGILRINKNLSVIPQILKGSSAKALWVNQQQSRANIAFDQKQTEFRKTMFDI